MPNELDLPTTDREDDRMLAIFCHLASFATAIPMGHILLPLGIWLWKRDSSAFINDQGREALNFQLSMTIYLIVTSLLCFVLIGFPILFGLLLFDIIVSLVAVFRVRHGIAYRYPLCIRFI